MKTWQVTSQDTQAGLVKWADGLYEAFVQLEPVLTTKDGFYGQIKQRSLPELDVSLVTSNGHEIRRLRSHINNRAADLLFVNILSRGRSQVCQRDAVEASPMDVSIVDTRQPYTIRHDVPFQLMSVAVPTDWICPQATKYHALHRTAAGRELSSVIWSIAKMLLNSEEDHGDFASRLASQMRHSLSLLPQVDRDDDASRTSVDILKSYLRRHYNQPDLRADQLAAHFNISVRRVHQLFEPTAFTVSEYINEIRLTCAADLLKGGPDLWQTISDVAWRVGYADPSYFSRRFKRRFGCTPRCYAQMHQPASIARLS